MKHMLAGEDNYKMNTSNTEEIKKFFHEISPLVLNLVSRKFKYSSVAKYKGKDQNTMNFVTEADLAVEHMVVEEIKKRFPHDKIVAEENYADTNIENKGRFWIIDPICGTSNFAKDIRLFVTNIALAQDRKLIASCAIDHAQGEYIWSTGNNKIFINEKQASVERKSSGTVIEVDLGGAMTASRKRKEQYLTFLSRIVLETNYAPLAYNSSLGFAYASIGRIDGYVCADVNVWDIAAANFLMQASGGIVTRIDGSPWTLESRDAVAARDGKLHAQLVKFLNQ